MADSDPVGVKEIADRLGVQQNTVHAWRKRGQFIPERWTVHGYPTWDWPDVQAWHRARRAPARIVCLHCGSDRPTELLRTRPRDAEGRPLPVFADCPSCGARIGLTPVGDNWRPYGIDHVAG